MNNILKELLSRVPEFTPNKNISFETLSIKEIKENALKSIESFNKSSDKMVPDTLIVSTKFADEYEKIIK